MANRAVRKRLTYRDLTGTPQAAHVEHWRNFRWTTGPWVVTSTGPWGLVRVLASSPSEGRRVIRHAGAIGGWDPDGDPEAEWDERITTYSRNGRTAEVGVKIRAGIVRVSKREGPSGAPLA